MMTFVRLLVISFLLSSSTVFAASTWRCTNGLVSSGNTQDEVVRRCGVPYSKTFLGYGRRVSDDWYNSFEDVALEEWIYIVRDNLYYELKFEGGYLKEIKSRYHQ